MEVKKENQTPLMVQKVVKISGVLVLWAALIVLLGFLLMNSYKNSYSELETRFPEVPKAAIIVDSAMSALLPFTISAASHGGEFKRKLDKIFVDNMSQICSVNGITLFRISDSQVAYTYAKDRIIGTRGEELEGFCIEKDTTEKEITFLPVNDEPIKEIVSVANIGGQIVMKRQNGYIVTLYK